MIGGHVGEVPYRVAEDGPCILTTLMVSSSNGHYNEHYRHCTGRIPG